MSAKGLNQGDLPAHSASVSSEVDAHSRQSSNESNYAVTPPTHEEDDDQRYLETHQNNVDLFRKGSVLENPYSPTTKQAENRVPDWEAPPAAFSAPIEKIESRRLRVSSLPRRRRLSQRVKGTGDVFRRISLRVPGVQNLLQKNDEIIDKERTIYFNQPLPESELDPETGHNAARYPRNKIRTTKYTPLNFIPKNLFHQFHNVANIYFLLIVILGAFSIFGVLNPGLAAVPIIAIVIITAIKDGIEDYRRTVLDLEVNNSITHILFNLHNPNASDDQVNAWRRFKKASTRLFVGIIASIKKAFVLTFMKSSSKAANYRREAKRAKQGTELEPVNSLGTVFTRETVASHVASLDPSLHNSRAAKDGNVIDYTKPVPQEAKFKRAYWKSVKVGDIIKIYNNDEVPADMVILSTSDPDGACYVETRNLDGETNLKIRQSLRATQEIRRSRDLERARFRIESEGPHVDLYSYNGLLKWDQHQNLQDDASPLSERAEAASINNLLLRGCSLRNTKWVIGIAVYTGKQTKIILNSGVTPTKRSRFTRLLNTPVIVNFFFVVMLALVAGIVNGVSWHKSNNSAAHFEFGSIGSTPAVTGIITFWASVILLQNLIPISLYITIEIIKTLQAFFIFSDTYMYYDKVDYPCTPKSWSISDDLGQIEYIFSDKTGTLTQNVMEFKKCTINGKSYGKAFTEAMIGILKRDGNHSEAISASALADIAKDKAMMISKLRAIYDDPQLYDDDVTFVSSEIVDDLQGASGKPHAGNVDHFLTVLSLCHSVLPERASDGSERLIYKAQSPDESALVGTAKDLGFALTERTRNGVIMDRFGVSTDYDILCTLEFNSTRKRMSVIARMPDGRIFLFCKGADNVIFGRLSPNSQAALRESTAAHLEEFASEGLRTLCLAEKELSEEVYQEWAARHETASQAILNREEQMEIVADEIERDLMLIGGTAIEDRLQDGVPQAIEVLGEAGIKLWVLTGDKVETAINIGFSCNLLDNSMELLVLQFKGKPVAEVETILDGFLKRFNLTGSPEDMAAARIDHSVPSGRFAMIIDGDALETVLAPELREKFVLLGKQCKSVLCCRVSPSQKASVVSAVKLTLDVTTLAIGDGANDVAMIQEADVGVGIAGVEGRQAVMSSDYAFGQFRFLARLLLVHGRWDYRRLAEMTANLFFKNVVFTMTLFWYGIDNNFDSTYLFDYTYITLFNLAFTSLPVIFMGFLDQDVNDRVSLAVPQLYQRGILRKEWTPSKFWLYILDGLYQSAVCYFFAFFVFWTGGFVTTVGIQNNYREAYGVFVATSAIIVCNLYVLINEYQWDWLFMLMVLISILLVFFWTGIYTAFIAAGPFYKAAPQVYGSLAFWAYLLVAVVACLLPRWTLKCYQKMFRPLDIDIIREQVKQHKFDHVKNPEDQFQNNDTSSSSASSADEATAAEKSLAGAEASNTNSNSSASAPTMGDAAASLPVPVTAHEKYRASLDRLSGERIRLSSEVEGITRASTLLKSRT